MTCFRLDSGLGSIKRVPWRNGLRVWGLGFRVYGLGQSLLPDVGFKPLEGIGRCQPHECSYRCHAVTCQAPCELLILYYSSFHYSITQI